MEHPDGKPRRRRFDKQFKIDAVGLIGVGGKNAAQVARELDINPEMLYQWKRKFQESGPVNAFPGNGKLSAEDVEKRQLEREIARLREENEILKKAMGYFAKAGR